MTYISSVMFFAFLGLNSELISAHSFLECANYPFALSGRPEDFSDEKCMGYPRYWAWIRSDEVNSGTNIFGVTSQKTWPLSGDENVDLCKFPYLNNERDYSDGFPMATYTVGGTYRLVWPAKNHAESLDGESCQVGRRKDNGLELYVNINGGPIAEDATSVTDPTSVSQMQLLKDWYQDAIDEGVTFEDGFGVRGYAFQNCPDFCHDTDNAVCYGDWEFTQEQFSSIFGSQEGIYTFVWLWRFQSENSIFSTCFEAKVEANGEVVQINTEQDSVDSEEEDVEPDAVVMTIPVCYRDGNLYVQTEFENALDQVSALTSEQVTFTIRSALQNNAGDFWNASVETNPLQSDMETLMYTLTSPENGTFCILIESQLGNVGTCTVCGGASGRAVELESNTSGSSGNSEGLDGALLALIIVLVLIIVITLVGLGYYKYTKSKTESDASTQIVSATNVPQTNVVQQTNGAPQITAGTP